ncbi:MAG: CBS domain-containing protein [Syntrophales bacterium]|nr:CBS domain-containing protein [Syntrophales bacterium]
MKVKDIMTKSPVKTKADSTLREVSRFLIKHHLNGMPVVGDDRRLLGIITRADIFRTLLPSYDEIYQEKIPWDLEQVEERAMKAGTRKVEEVMSKSVITVEEDTPVLMAGSTLLLKRIKQLPVLRKERLIGMVTLTDIIEALILP